VRKCQCNTFKAHEKALADANAKVASANKASWTKAAHLKCVLAGKTTNACTVPAMPKVKAVALAAGVNAGRCSSWEGKAQCGNAVCSNCKNKANFLGRIYRQTGDQSWNSGCFMKAEIPKQRTNDYRLTGSWNAHGTGRGGQKHAMWGFREAKDLKSSGSHNGHYYGSIDYAFYCTSVNARLHIYEKGSSKGYGGQCHCGTVANFRQYMYQNANVVYEMASNQHGWRSCRTVGGASKSKAYVVDESIYGKYCDLNNLHLMKNVNGQYVDFN